MTNSPFNLTIAQKDKSIFTKKTACMLIKMNTAIRTKLSEVSKTGLVKNGKNKIKKISLQTRKYY